MQSDQLTAPNKFSLDKAKVQEIINLTQQSDWRIRLWLGEEPPECTQMTMVGARDAYRNEMLTRAERAAAFIKWNKLALEAVEKATSLDDVMLLYHQAPAWGEGAKAALAKWIVLSTTVPEVEEAYRQAFFNDRYDICALAVKKMYELLTPQ